MKIKIKKNPRKTSGKGSTKAPKQNPFEAVLDKSHQLPVLVQFFATWCGPCKTLKPIIEKVAKNAKGKWALAMVDVEQHQAVAMGYNVRSIPEVKLFHKGEVIASFKGVKPDYLIEKWLQTNLPKKKKSSKFQVTDSLLRKGNVTGATTSLLMLLKEENPKLEMANILMALHAMGKNNAMAMQALNEVNPKSEYKNLVKQIKGMIEMDSDEKDPHTPTHSPYNPSSTSANDPINFKKFNEGLMIQLVNELINEVRKSQGAGALGKNRVLRSAAKDHNNYQIKHDILTHDQKDPRKRTVKNRVDSFGGKFRTVGENVQYQGMQVIQRNNRIEVISETYIQMAQKLVENWVKSPGHYQNMINPKFTLEGTAIGWNPENSSVFATQVFGG